MGARYPYYLLADSRDGQIKEGEQVVVGRLEIDFKRLQCQTLGWNGVVSTPFL